MRTLLTVVLALGLAAGAALADKVPDEKPYSKGNLDCSGALPIACGDIVSGTTVGGVNNVGYYSCVGYLESGPEMVYELTIEGPECYELYITLTADGCDLDVFVLGSCDEDDCIDYVDTQGTIDACLEPGTYYIVVDGYHGAECAFDLELTCTECECPVPCPEEQNSMPFHEDFEREECFPPAGWTILNLGSDPSGTTWEWADNSYTCDPPGSARCSYASSSEFQEEWMITPVINLEGASGIVVSFQHNMAYWGDCTDPMQVLYSTTDTDPASFTLRLDYTCDLPNPLCGTSTLEIPGLASDHVYVAWRYQGTYAGSWYVDNVDIVELVVPMYACCFPDGSCQDLSEADCADGGGVFYPENNCDDVGFECPQPPQFVCCVGEECVITTEAGCADLSGEWHPEWDSCGPPNPCEEPVPAETATWGAIKSIYR
ncbi:MAG: choice-of-anchor J domain-containing protein [Candidatus Eisenbacteria sp.]|nr:choice-of-anchor J domain-containing protein [Candidatus Eisenbacteria bacterium]